VILAFSCVAKPCYLHHVRGTGRGRHSDQPNFFMDSLGLGLTRNWSKPVQRCHGSEPPPQLGGLDLMEVGDNHRHIFSSHSYEPPQTGPPPIAGGAFGVLFLRKIRVGLKHKSDRTRFQTVYTAADCAVLAGPGKVERQAERVRGQIT
jgi:hypothetical protein